MGVPPKDVNWTLYYAQVGQDPNPVVCGVLARDVEHRGAALDVGAGNYRDSNYLLAAGFKKVVAVEPSIYAPPPPCGIELLEMQLQNLNFPYNMFDYIICCNTLFHVSAADTLVFLAHAKQWLRPRSVLLCNVLGERDDWAAAGSNEYLTDKAIQSLDRLLPGVWRDSEETTNTDSSGNPKHWHVWTLVYKR